MSEIKKQLRKNTFNKLLVVNSLLNIAVKVNAYRAVGNLTELEAKHSISLYEMIYDEKFENFTTDDGIIDIISKYYADNNIDIQKGVELEPTTENYKALLNLMYKYIDLGSNSSTIKYDVFTKIHSDIIEKLKEEK